ncbi:MAG: hypothetical protein WBM13_06020, partial [Bacteroidia bacterium]
EITSVSTDPSLSGLRFTNLTNASPSITGNPGNNKVLTVDSDGDVVLVYDITSDAQTVSLTQAFTTMQQEINTLKSKVIALEKLLVLNN